MPKPTRPAALQYRAKPALIATAYIIVLVVPWILTCVLSSRTVRQSWDNSGAVERETAWHLHRVSFLIDALNFIAAVAALPAIYALLARAAVVFSQRTNNRKTLNVRQLFALADRNFVRYGLTGRSGAESFFFFLGAALILLSVVLPPIRAILVHTESKLFPEAKQGYSKDYWVNGWVGERVGADPLIRDVGSVPRRLVVEKTRHALINAFPTEWTAEAWYDPDASYKTGYAGRYFVSSLARDTTTGMYRQHALRMNSSSMCEGIPASEVPVPCPGPSDHVFDTLYDNANLTVHICVPHVPGDQTPRWNDTEDRQELSETLYITVSSPVYYNGSTTYSNDTLRCTGNTSMGYFELGNSFNGGKFGPLLSSVKFWTSRGTPREFSDDVRELTYPGIYFDPTRTGESLPPRDYGTLTDTDGLLGGPGPLALAAHAMFGAGSFFELAQFIREPNDTLSQTLCQMSPIPFSRTALDLGRCDPRDESTMRYSRSAARGRFASAYGWANDKVEALISGIRASSGEVTGLLNTAMYLANKATLEVAVGPGAIAQRNTWDPRQIWRADGIEIRTPVVSTAGLVVVTVLLGLQVTGILAVIWYIYSVPTWTETLDAMAVARATWQLPERDGGFFRLGALRRPTPEEVRQMEDMDALVGLVEHEALEHLPANTTRTRVSDEVTLAGGASPDADHVLNIGAPGLISRNMKKASESSV